MLWKSPGLAVEAVDLLTSAPTFQTRSKSWRIIPSKGAGSINQVWLELWVDFGIQFMT